MTRGVTALVSVFPVGAHSLAVLEVAERQSLEGLGADDVYDVAVSVTVDGDSEKKSVAQQSHGEVSGEVLERRSSAAPDFKDSCAEVQDFQKKVLGSEAGRGSKGGCGSGKGGKGGRGGARGATSTGHESSNCWTSEKLGHYAREPRSLATVEEGSM